MSTILIYIPRPTDLSPMLGWFLTVPPKARSNFEGWKLRAKKIKNNIERLDDLEGEEASGAQSDLEKLKHELRVANLQVEGWEFVFVLKGETKAVEDHIQNQIKDIQAKVRGLASSAGTSTKSSSISG